MKKIILITCLLGISMQTIGTGHRRTPISCVCGMFCGTIPLVMGPVMYGMYRSLNLHSNCNNLNDPVAYDECIEMMDEISANFEKHFVLHFTSWALPVVGLTGMYLYSKRQNIKKLWSCMTHPFSRNESS